MFFGLGAATFFGLGLLLQSGTGALDGGETVQGVVVDVQSEMTLATSGSPSRRVYRPVVEFVDPGTGLVDRVTAAVSGGSEPKLGSERDVSVRPGYPGGAVVLGGGWIAWVLFGIGGFVLAFGALILFAVWPRDRSGQNRPEAGN